MNEFDQRQSIIERLDTVIEQQAVIIRLLETAQAHAEEARQKQAEKKPQQIGPFLQ